MADEEIRELISGVEPTQPPDTQPLRNVPERGRRHWVPATWTAPGMGGGHPKVSGGIEVDNHTGLEVPRAFNRPDQRYSQADATMEANRAARAASEYPATAVLQGAQGRYEVRGPSGNQYDVSPTVDACDCPDHFRLQESGKPSVRCKHRQMVLLALSDPSLPAGPNWSAERLSEYTGLAVETVRKACAQSVIPATKINGVWSIPPAGGPLLLTHYTPLKPELGSLTPPTAAAGSGDTTVTIDGTGFCMASRAVWDAQSVFVTTFVTLLQVTAVIPALYLASPGTHNLRVENAFPGGSTSLPVDFIVT